MVLGKGRACDLLYYSVSSASFVVVVFIFILRDWYNGFYLDCHENSYINLLIWHLLLLHFKSKSFVFLFGRV
jgi:hypothetical protein